MVKTLFRIIMILMAAALVTAGLFVIVNSMGNIAVVGPDGQISEASEGEFQRPLDTEGLLPQDGDRPLPGDRELGSVPMGGILFGFISLAAHLGLVAGVTAGIALLKRLIRRLHIRKHQVASA